MSKKKMNRQIVFIFLIGFAIFPIIGKNIMPVQTIAGPGMTDEDTEPNNDRDSAFELRSGGYDLNQGDNDWYKIWVKSGHYLDTYLWYSSSLTWMGIEIYNSSVDLLAENGTVEDATYLTTRNNFTDQYFYILVYGQNSGEYYYLEAILTDIYTDDDSEPNNDVSSAFELHYEYYYDLEQWDDDWYKVNITTNTNVYLYFYTAYDNGYKQVGINIYDENLDLIAQNLTSADYFSTEWDNLNATNQMYYIHVYGLDVGDTYTLGMDKTTKIDPPFTEMIYSVNTFSFNLSYEYWKFSNITYEQTSKSDYMYSEEFSIWNLTTNTWDQKTEIWNDLADAYYPKDFDMFGINTIDQYYEIPRLCFIYARSGENLLNIYNNSYYTDKFDEYAYGLDWLKFWDSSDPSDMMYFKIDTTSGVLLEFQTLDIHIKYIEDFPAYEESLYDIPWGVSPGDEIQYNLISPTDEFEYNRCKYVITEIRNETIGFKFPSALYPESTATYYFRASNVYAEFYYWDAVLESWVESADFLGRTSPIMIGSANREIVFALFEGEEYYPPILMPKYFQFSQSSSDYSDLFGTSYENSISSAKSLYVELSLDLDGGGAITMYYNMTYFDNGTLAFYQGRTPLFGSLGYLDFTLIRYFEGSGTYVPPTTTTTDTTSSTTNGTETTGTETDPFAVPGYTLPSLLGSFAIGILVIVGIKKKKKFF